MKTRSGAAEEKPIPTIGSSATVGLCKLDVAPESEDPWANYRDPWSTSLKKVSVPHAAPDPSAALRQVEDRIEKAVLAKLPTSGHIKNMEVGGDERLAAIEAQSQLQDSKVHDMELQIQRLVTHQQSLEAKIDANARKVDGQVSQLQVQVAAQFDAQSTRMEDMFSRQMDQLSALLAKRARTE